jgi:hypothetical protein
MIDYYMADSLEFENYLAGLPFMTQELMLDATATYLEWTYYSDELGPYLLFSNQDALTTTTGIHARVALSSAVDAVAEGSSSPGQRRISLHPNPFTSSMRLAVDARGTDEPAVRVFDATGRLVRGLGPPDESDGRLVYTWNGHDERGSRVSNGVYFLEFEAECWRWTEKVLFCGGKGGVR